MEELQTLIESCNFGRPITWYRISRNLCGDIKHPAGEVQLSIMKRMNDDQYIILDAGTVSQIVPCLDLNLLYGWHCRDGILFKTFSADQVANVVRDIIQVLEESTFYERVQPRMTGGAPMHLT